MQRRSPSNIRGGAGARIAICCLLKDRNLGREYNAYVVSQCLAVCHTLQVTRCSFPAAPGSWAFLGILGPFSSPLCDYCPAVVAGGNWEAGEHGREAESRIYVLPVCRTILCPIHRRSEWCTSGHLCWPLLGCTRSQGGVPHYPHGDSVSCEMEALGAAAPGPHTAGCHCSLGRVKGVPDGVSHTCVAWGGHAMRT